MSEQKTVAPCCFSGHLHKGTPVGSVETVAGLPTYVSKPRDGSKKKSLIIGADIFGWELNNTRLLSDAWAEAGFYVYLPDLHEGDMVPVKLENVITPNFRERDRKSEEDKAQDQKTFQETMPAWLEKHNEARTKELLEPFFAHVHEQASAEGGKVGGIGFCWGARYIAQLTFPPSSSSASSTRTSQLAACVAYHPSFVQIPTELNLLASPTFFALASHDEMIFPPESIEQTRKVFEERRTSSKEEAGEGLDLKVKVYEKTVHGFACRGDEMIPHEKKMKEDALADGVEFMNKHLAA